MPTPNQDTATVFKSEVTPTQNGVATLIGTFAIPLVFENTANGLDHIEAQIEHAGQEFKRQKPAREVRRCASFRQFSANLGNF